MRPITRTRRGHGRDDFVFALAFGPECQIERKSFPEIKVVRCGPVDCCRPLDRVSFSGIKVDVLGGVVPPRPHVGSRSTGHAVRVLTSLTVADDGSKDVLTGGKEADWFVVSLTDWVNGLDLKLLETKTVV
jgi:hypothetical protein